MNKFPIPAKLNLFLALTQVFGSLALLTLASHTANLLLFSASVIAFSFLMQMGFSLLHEAEHDKLHSDKWVNDCQGTLLAAMFPGSYSFMKAAHLSHHRRNRSDAELVDYIRPGQSRGAKFFQCYFLICGGVWIGTPLLSLAIGLTPQSLLKRLGRNPKSGTAIYLQFVNESGQKRVRVELIFTALFGWSAIHFLGLSTPAVTLSYLVFAFSWSSQQYIYHIRTPRHRVEGALNLQLWKPLQALYLNFNYHLSHHRAVNVPWIHMARISESPQQHYWSTYREIWSPPEALENAWPVAFQNSGALPMRVSGNSHAKN